MSKYFREILNKVLGGVAKADENEKTNVDPSLLINLLKDCLHTVDNDEVLKRLETLLLSNKQSVERLINEDDSTINVLKYLSRLHGLPHSYVSSLYTSLRYAERDQETNYLAKFKVALALKYAVSHNHDFISLTDLLELLFEGFPPDTMISSNDTRREVISQLLLTIVIILKPDRIFKEKIKDGELKKLEGYVGYMNRKYQLEVKRCLENFRYVSGGSSHAFMQNGEIDGYHSNSVLPTEDRTTIQNKNWKVSAHVVKTQQTEAFTTEENVSEKIQMSNISLSSALEQGRERTIQAARVRETLDPPKSATGSDRSWYKTTSTEIYHFHKKAEGKGAISPDDVQYLRNKVNGFKFSFTQTYYTMIMMIADIFYMITKYQELSTTMMEELLDIVITPDFKNDEARASILKAIDRHFIRLGFMPQGIYEKLENFALSNKEKSTVTPWMSLINEILCRDDSYVTESLRRNVDMLIYGSMSDCADGLDYIQRQLAILSRRAEIEKLTNLVPTLFILITKYSANLSYKIENCYSDGENRQNNEADQSISQATVSVVQNIRNKISSKLKTKKYSNLALVDKMLEVLEDYLQLDWTPSLAPSNVDTLIRVARDKNAGETVLGKSTRCVLRSTDKSIHNDKNLQQISTEQNESHMGLLFDVSCSKKDRLLRILTMATLTKVLKMNSMRDPAKLVKRWHVLQWGRQLKRKDILLRGRGDEGRKVVLEEDLTEDGTPPTEDHEYVSDFVAQLLVILAQGKCPHVNIDSLISTVSQVFLNSKSKMTKILCSEFLFYVVVNSEVVFSVPVLNQIQSEALSSIGDIHVYMTAAFCTSLAKQARKNRILKSEHVNFLVNLYSFKEVKLEDKNYSEHINPNILKTFHAASKTGVEFSEEVFNLLALIMNSTCADNKDSPEYGIVKSILDSVAVFCDRPTQAAALPEVVVEAVENLFQESDVFEETCAAVVEKCMIIGRLIPNTVTEVFAKQLQEEPNVSIPALRRLLIANENQDLPESIFDSAQMNLIGLRLFSNDIIYPEGTALLQHEHLDTGGNAEGLFRCLAQNISKGMLLSKLTLEVCAKLLVQPKEKVPKNDIIECLTCSVLNGQYLPKELIDLPLKLTNESHFNAHEEYYRT